VAAEEEPAGKGLAMAALPRDRSVLKPARRQSQGTTCGRDL